MCSSPKRCLHRFIVELSQMGLGHANGREIQALLADHCSSLPLMEEDSTQQVE
jgi:hypothetical protein